MRILFAGTPAVAVPALRILLASEHDVVAVLTRPDARAGRGRTLVASPVKQLAVEHDIPVLTPVTLRDNEIQDQLRALELDVAAVVAYGNLIPRAALTIPQHGWVNLHFSLLPAWRGAAPVQHAVMAGQRETGAATFVLEAGLDTGPMLATITEPIAATDTAGDLLDRLAERGAPLLLGSLEGLVRGTMTPVPQPETGITLAPKIEVSDAEIDWTAGSFAVDALVRGTTPEPGSWTTFRDERCGVGPVTPLAELPAELADATPGTLHVTKRSVSVRTGDGAVQLGQVRPAGKKPMAAADWARGVRIGAGEGFTHG